ncbi:hypothetical protein PC116_g14487 [Phytophthora cactorum]|uniref:Uncharacterized protein n=1 Tax=Phytophthora cactorum TaxID=29920 RepID=A0A8T1KL09_9STRA|nr:hypothetical protein PC111_g9348 [Phytophthora cactorum]KAG2905383.1 hypothetical protein PC114_g11576 [Phytophthora cactorum]KAG2920473.1 hypothetical protein PC115_g9813 [Phytophthora cactorum]KAG2996868.1 hypothetical protein PC120_g21398 [Phytophthora cactorum]KAG3017459.1 hypothetical protein PC119_g11037 [Phytophthora cactorum]
MSPCATSNPRKCSHVVGHSVSSQSKTEINGFLIISSCGEVCEEPTKNVGLGDGLGSVVNARDKSKCGFRAFSGNVAPIGATLGRHSFTWSTLQHDRNYF